jgi:hypothetical protein
MDVRNGIECEIKQEHKQESEGTTRIEDDDGLNRLTPLTPLTLALTLHIKFSSSNGGYRIFEFVSLLVGVMIFYKHEECIASIHVGT